MIQGVFFDLDGTLYDRDAAILSMAEQQFEAFRDDFGDLSRSLFVERLVALDGHGHPRTPRLHHTLVEALGLPCRMGDLLEDYFRTHYMQHCVVTNDTWTTLETLRARGMKLGIITNGPTDWQSRKIEAMRIGEFFDAILISGSEGIEKPDPVIFARAVERCGVSTANSMFIGDHPEADIQGAKGAGLFPVWKQMDYWTVPEGVPRIQRISDILPLIG